MGSVIVGSGISVPPHRVTNDDLGAIMDTSDDWIRRRTGVGSRHLAAPGVGASDLAAEAVRAAVADAGLAPADIDLLITATMTPDQFAPGIAAVVQTKAGLGPVAAFDLRQQCSGFLYGLDLADAMVRVGRARHAVVVGAEVHTGYMPFGTGFEVLRGTRREPTVADRDAASASRAWSVLFGDGAGAVVVSAAGVGTDGGGDGGAPTGVLASRLFSDGDDVELIQVPGLGFRCQPYVDAEQLAAGLHLPRMNGAELFRRAATAMPAAVRQVLDDTGYTVADLDLVVCHQANERIVEVVRQSLGVDAEVAPTNIERYGNTTAATLPILFHELRADGRVPSGALVCFVAFGAGSHWGAALYRQP
jgi:3-oxoacyl-[acyl-carrier-protein] synthase III